MNKASDTEKSVRRFVVNIRTDCLIKNEWCILTELRIFYTRILGIIFMLDRTTAAIISAFRTAVSNYDEKCRGFLQWPSSKAIARKNKFMLLLGQLQDKTPEETIKTCYRFYEENKTDESRLLEEIRKVLFQYYQISTASVIFGRRPCIPLKETEEIRWRLFHRMLDETKIPQRELDKYNLRKVARIIGQAMRSHTSLFFTLPAEINMQIVAKAVSRKELTQEDAWEVAKENFSKLKMK